MRALFRPALAVATLLAAMAHANASGLLGSAVDVTANVPTVQSIYQNPGNTVVSAGIEYKAGTYSSYNPRFIIDIGANLFTISLSNGFTDFGSAPFNGFVLNVFGGVAITGVSVDAASGLAPVSETLSLNGTRLAINLAGEHLLAGNSIILDLTTTNDAPPVIVAAVAEPSSLIVLASGLAAIPLLRRRRRLNSVISP